jgi:OPA family glycerol-3-phosphate transporter-like MFS transporter
MIAGSLLLSGTINLVIALGAPFYLIKWLWMINGFALSILWPTVIRLLSESLPTKALGTSSVIMGTTVAVGTFIIYGLSALYAWVFESFKPAFYTAAIAVIAVSFVWLLLYNKAVTMSVEEKNNEEITEDIKKKEPEKISMENDERKLLYLTIGVLCFIAVGVNLIKDGLGTWVPAILKDEFGMGDSLSILLTLLLPMVAILGNAFALNVHKKIPDYVNHCGITFMVIVVAIFGIIGFLKIKIALLMLVILIIAKFMASSLNSLVTGIFPLFMRGKVNSGLFAGILNGFCYVGSALSSYGLGAIADNFGWTAVFITLGIFCALTVVVWTGYNLYKKKVS